MPAHVVALCTTRLSVTVTATTCVMSGACSISPRSTISRPSTSVPMPRGPNQPMNSRSCARQIAANERDQHRDESDHEQRENRENHHPPIGVAPSDDHRVAAEHREHHQLQQLPGGIGYLSLGLGSRPPSDERERQAAGEGGDETAAVQAFSRCEAHQCDRESGQLRPGLAHPPAAS